MDFDIVLPYEPIAWQAAETVGIAQPSTATFTSLR